MKKGYRVGVGVLILKGDKVLFGKRNGPHGKGTWSLPGGHLEFKETLGQCTEREVFEEAGIKVKGVRFAGVTEDFYPDSNKYYITVFMICHYKSGQLKTKEPHKMSHWKWVSWDNLPKPLFLSMKNLLKQGFNPFK